jgi:hypothetical protein
VPNPDEHEIVIMVVRMTMMQSYSMQSGPVEKKK